MVGRISSRPCGLCGKGFDLASTIPNLLPQSAKRDAKPAKQALPLELEASALYPRFVPHPPASHRSPTPGLFLGLIITLAAVVACSGYITWQISGLRELQNNLVDRNRKDSLQLLRIQNDLNTLALAMRDMLDSNEPYPLTAWSAQFQRVREDLNDALRHEEQVAVADRTPEQREYLKNSMAQFWDAVDRIFALAADNKAAEARTQIQLSLQARQAALSTAVARLLVQNNESEEQAALRIAQIYDRVQRQVYLFLALTLVAILLTGPVLDPLQPATVCATGGALRAAQRVGAEADLDPGIDSAPHFPRAA